MSFVLIKNLVQREMFVVFKKIIIKQKKLHIQWVFWDGFLSLFFWVDFFY
jgi:hypothetical protein